MKHRDATRWPKPRGLGTPLLRVAAWTAPTVAKYTHGSLGYITNPNGEALLVTHKVRETGLWGFPGGTQFPQEDPLNAVVREIEEEAGVSIDPRNVKLAMSYSQPWAWHFDHLFVGTIGFQETEAVSSLEIKSVRFANVNELEQDAKLTRATAYALHMLKNFQTASEQ